MSLDYLVIIHGMGGWHKEGCATTSTVIPCFKDYSFGCFTLIFGTPEVSTYCSPNFRFSIWMMWHGWIIPTLPQFVIWFIVSSKDTIITSFRHQISSVTIRRPTNLVAFLFLVFTSVTIQNLVVLV